MPMSVPYTLIFSTTTAKSVTFKNHLEEVKLSSIQSFEQGYNEKEAKRFTSLTLIQTHTYENEELMFLLIVGSLHG